MFFVNAFTKTMRLSVIIIAIYICSISAFHLEADHMMDYETYKLDYNYTLGQANYAIYKLSSYTRMSKCWDKWVDGENYTWYSYSGMLESFYIDRSHLAPIADVGTDSCTMNNIVPMNDVFYNNTWKKLEKFLRTHYFYHWVAVGCKYNYENYVTTLSTDQILYTIDGCYYIVFDTNPISTRNVKITTNGYILLNSTETSELPWWIQDNSQESIITNVLLIMMIFIIFPILLCITS
jgi:hypothetical protein